MINLLVVFTATSLIPPATGVMYVAPCIIGFFAQVIWKRYRFEQWSKFNYVTSAALGGGTALAAVIIFFALEHADGPNMVFLENGWWGDVAWTNTADAMQAPYLKDLPLTNAQGETVFAGTPLQLGFPAT